MTEIHQTRIDGVPCFWVETGRPTLAATLRFRSGLVDEQVPRAGWLHLIEHMALHGRGGGALAINGSVSFLETTFDAHGPVDLVADHLRATTSWLNDPDFTDLDRERNVLRAEGRTRGGMAVDAFIWRYGARGPGLCAMDELGLGRASAESLTSLAHRTFTRSNAVLALDGPPPAGLRIHLPDGDGRVPIPVAVPCEQTFPGSYVENRGVILTGVAPRSPAATLVPALLQEELRTHLRNEAGAAYAPWASYEPVDAESAVVLAGADIDIAAYPDAAKVVVGIVDRLASSGPSEEALQNVVDQYVQVHTDPYNAATFAWRAASRTLMGFEVETAEEILTGITALAPASLGGELADLRSSLLLGRPADATEVPGLTVIERPDTGPTPGQEFRSINWPADRTRLTVGPAGVQVHDDGRRLAVCLEDSVGTLAYSDGKRVVLSRDGWNLAVDPADWHDGAKAVRLLDEHVPGDLLLPQPDQDWGPGPQRLGAWQRWWPAFLRAIQLSGTSLAVFGVGLILVGLLVQAYLAVLFGVFWVGRGIYQVSKQERPATTEPPDLRANSHIGPPI